MAASRAGSEELTINLLTRFFELAHFLLKVRRKGGVGTELSRLPLTDNSALMPSPEFLLPFDDQTSDFSGAGIRTLESVVALQATFIVMWRVSVFMPVTLTMYRICRPEEFRALRHMSNDLKK
ncbi:hypothetical protein J6590_002780 [Homalodisca vitripennis]|nr:hypothetical protein J6590_002780 [Homalodisca vitripennis]